MEQFPPAAPQPPWPSNGLEMMPDAALAAPPPAAQGATPSAPAVQEPGPQEKIQPPWAHQESGSQEKTQGPRANQRSARKIPKTLEQMISLKPGDDLRTEVSKKVSWILRHGASKAGVEMDQEGWVLMADLMRADIMQGISADNLFQVIQDSNKQKSRYEVKNTEHGEAIRALAKHTISSIAGATTAKERRRRDPRGERKDRDGGGEDRDGGPRDGGQNNSDKDAVLSFEQQLAQGFQPVYHGGKVIAMVQEGQTVRPGRREEDKGRGKGRGRGKGKGGAEGPVGDSRPRWLVQNGQEAILRANKYMESEELGTIAPGSIVVQTGNEEVMQHGIVRMPVEYYSEMTDVIIHGWVTRTAEAANGPVFFTPVKGGKGPESRGKGAHTSRLPQWQGQEKAVQH